MTQIQEFLRNGGTFEQLKELGIKTKRHAKHPNLVLFKYDIGAVFANKLVQECRGIVLDENDSWRIVCRAFDKFFNHGEFYAAEINWQFAYVQEKLDGSLATLYWYAGEWHVATTGTPDASGDVNGEGTFEEYFRKTFKTGGGQYPDAKYRDFCFSFELMGPRNRIVVVHEYPWVRLLAARNRVTGDQYFPEQFAPIVNIPSVQSFPLGSVEEIMASFEHISPVSQEGYVVVDSKFNRLKIKHPGYVALHHAKDGMGPKAYVEIARTGEVTEVLTAFPEFKPLIEEARTKYSELVKSVRADYERLKHLPDQKSFAIEAIKTQCSAALFQMRKGQDLEEFFRSVAVDKLMGWMSYG